MKRSRLSRKGIKARKTRMKVEPFSFGKDVRGDNALFIPESTRMDDERLINAIRSHAGKSGGVMFTMNPDGTFSRSSSLGLDQVFFRVLDSKGNQMHSHGWIRYNPETKKAEVMQWG